MIYDIAFSYIIYELCFKSVPLPRTAASFTPGSLTCSTKTVSLPVATVHNYNDYDENRKGVRINQKLISVPERNVIGSAGVKYTKGKHKNNKGAKSSSQKISDCQKDHLAFQAYLR